MDAFVFTPQPMDQIPFVARDFPLPTVELVPGLGWVAKTAKPGARAEVLGRTPEIAVHQLARLLNQKEGRS